MMWIRSQNEMELIKVNNFRVIKRSGSSMFKCPYCIETRTPNEFMYLGEYSTIKKALKVLDMIVNYINSGGKMFVTDQHKTDFGMSAVYEKILGVFQMPKDDEVKE